MGKNDIVVVGSFNQDFFWSMQTFPRPGQTVTGTYTSGPGGKGANQALAAARGGARSVFIGAVGDDYFGHNAPAFFEKEGIEHHLAVKKKHATGNAAIWVDANGRNDIVVSIGANNELMEADIPDKVIERAQIVLCQNESRIETNHHVFKIARQAGVKTILNPAPMRGEFDPSILGLTDVLVPNETEFVGLVAQLGLSAGGFSDQIMTGLWDQDLHELCRAFEVPVVILTLGKRGCLVSTEGGFQHLSAIEVEHVVDTSGAGDAFVGGLAAGFIRFDHDVIKAAEMGDILAGLSVTRRHTADSIPQRAEIEGFIKTRDL